MQKAIRPVTVTAEAAVNNASSTLREPSVVEKGNMRTRVPVKMVIK